MSAITISSRGGYESPIPIENFNQIIIIVTSALAIFVPTSLVGLRMLAEYVTGKRVSWSDYCIIIALLFNYGLHFDMFIMVLEGGFGYHVEEIISRFGPDCLSLFSKGAVAFSLLWNGSTLFSKISMLLLYTKLIPVRKMISPARCMIGFVVISHISYVVTQFLICRPFAKNWDQTIDGTCGSQQAYYFSVGCINAVVDLIILTMPMPFIARLNLAIGKKMMIMGMFAAGLTTVSISVCRQILLPSVDFVDMSYSGVMTGILSGLEPAVAIALACIPCLPQLFGTLPKTLPSTHPSRKSGVGAQSPWSKRSPVTTQPTEAESRPFHRLEEEDGASRVQLQTKRESSRFSMWSESKGRGQDDTRLQEESTMEAGLGVGAAR